MSVCTQCMRALRRQARLEQLTLSQTRPSQLRCLSTTSARYQQPQAQSKPESQVQPGTPPSILTTAPTITSNLAADAPPPAPAAGSPSNAPTSASSQVPAPSTAEMQKQISSRLGSSRVGGGIGHKIATSLRSAAKSTTETYITYGLTEAMFKSCAAQAPYTIPEDQRMGVYTGKGPPKNARAEDVGVPETSVPGSQGAQSWWFTRLGLEPTFSVWSQVCFLHMYILTVKLRTLPDQRTYMEYQRYLLEHFSSVAEDKMILLHGMNARGVRNKYLKDLFVQWRGIQYAYDQGLVSGDAVLAGAVWRNLWKADEEVDWEKVALVVGFMRRAIAGLADSDINDIATNLQQSSQYWEQAQQGLDGMVNLESTGIRDNLREEAAAEKAL
ncbi:Serine carboxypeptidase 3 [Lithohypha guttulata]|uniref:Serine carboxypeptidase 3 n=1 Tax=Lithohypha guttulata TaxID=1690604 RepID=A0AAN7YC16_9EURO|nr:Serine carboxypeptidase 3 [Lithohypha guttulata]KAK5101326.1 Serine carboxypeptidase 3 [Lithohypha guttulata]